MLKNLIFDFGGIFIDLDKTAIPRSLQELGLKELTEEMIEQNLIYEKGLMSTEEFMEFYQTLLPDSSKEVLLDAWNSSLINIPKKRFDFLKKLKKNKAYRLILLSNTNDLHMRWVAENIGFYDDFKKCFDAFYLSHKINMRKPDKEIYEYVLQQNNLVAEESLFIDDLPENTKAAEELGIHTWNLNPEQEDVTELFTAKQELLGGEKH